MNEKKRVYIVAVIGFVGFLIFIGSTGEIYPEIPTNYVGIILGLLLVSVSFLLASQKKSKQYIKDNLNNEA